MPTEYRGLHSAEKKELRNAGRGMYDAVNALDNAATRAGLRYTTYGRYFQDARTKLTVIYEELCVARRYIDDTDRYDIARKELDDGKTLLFNAKGRNELTGAGDYEELQKKVLTCEATTTKYAQAWIEILAFDRRNSNPNAQRVLGYHAFLKADMAEMRVAFDRRNSNPNAQRVLGYHAFKKADMAEMRGLLAEMGADRCEGALNDLWHGVQRRIVSETPQQKIEKYWNEHGGEHAGLLKTLTAGGSTARDQLWTICGQVDSTRKPTVYSAELNAFIDGCDAYQLQKMFDIMIEQWVWRDRLIQTWNIK